MVESKQETFVTGVDPNEEKGILSSSDDDYNQSSDEEEAGQNTYFHVQDAEPPMNFEDAYSTLPSKIKLQTIKKDICSSIKFKQEKVQKDMQTSQMSSESKDKRGGFMGKKIVPVGERLVLDLDR